MRFKCFLFGSGSFDFSKKCPEYTLKNDIIDIRDMIVGYD